MVALGVIVGNRGFFPDHLCATGRRTVLNVLKGLGIRAIVPPVKASNCGAVETLAEAKIYADFFKQQRDKIDGVLVTLPNFGDERAVANTIRMAGLDVPVLVHAFSDDPKQMTIEHRRDSFCGKISICNNLRQYGIKYSLTGRHTVAPESDDFKVDLQRFTAVCRTVKALRGLRVGMIGARPAAFNTVRFSEKLLERHGISVETVDLSEVFGWVGDMKDRDAAVARKLKAIALYTDVKGVPEESLLKMAKLGVAIDRWMKDNALSATAIQCWTSMEEYYGVVPCTLMSMLSNRMLSSACETDVGGVVGMVALGAATEQPAGLLDWNNNYGDDPDKGVVFHCSNIPKALLGEQRMDYQGIIAGAVGKEKTYGTVVGRLQAGPFTFCRVSTDDLNGSMAAYCGEGRFTNDAIDTFGGYGVIHIKGLQRLLRTICESGFEHHVAASPGSAGASVAEALGKYMGWPVHHHMA